MEGKVYTAVERFRGSGRPTGTVFTFEDEWEDWPEGRILTSERLSKEGYDLYEGDIVSKIRFVIYDNYITGYEIEDD